MSFGTIADYNALASMVTKNSGKTGGVSTAQPQLQKAFDQQMRMAHSIFGEGSQVYGEGSSPGTFDDSFVHDAMMMEAISTITRLMQTESIRPQQGTGVMTGRPVNQSNATPQESLAASGSVASSAARQGLASQTAPEVGSLSARFESGNSGVGTIGYDRVGGTSYGKYQIASKPGTMDRFITYLDDKAPVWADRLRDAGPANTGSKEGEMPAAWQAIARENPDRFEKLQHDFIARQTYDPARNMILEQTGLDFNNAPAALREVLWSTSVQHGPTGAARIFGKVIDRFVGTVQGGEFNSKLIEGVYDTRKGQFGSSTRRVQEAVANRFDQEKQLALNMLGTQGINRIV